MNQTKLTREQVIAKIARGDSDVATDEAKRFGIKQQEVACAASAPWIVVGLGAELSPEVAELAFSPPPVNQDD